MKNKKIYLIIILIVIAIITIIIFATRSKYVLEKQTLHAQNSERFYLESDLVDVEEKQNTYDNWNGESSYTVNIAVKNHEDAIRINNLTTNYRVVPTIITPTGNSNVTINTTINGTSTNIGQMQANIKKDDNIAITVNPNGESLSNISFRVEVISEEPYSKTLVGTFTISKGNTTTYTVNLQDLANQEYAKLLIRTDEFNGTLRIYYNNLLAIPDTICELLSGKTINNYSGDINYVDVILEQNSNYQIDFIKRNIANRLTLGDVISTSDICIKVP